MWYVRGISESIAIARYFSGIESCVRGVLCPSSAWRGSCLYRTWRLRHERSYTILCTTTRGTRIPRATLVDPRRCSGVLSVAPRVEPRVRCVRPDAHRPCSCTRNPLAPLVRMWSLSSASLALARLSSDSPVRLNKLIIKLLVSFESSTPHDGRIPHIPF